MRISTLLDKVLGLQGARVGALRVEPHPLRRDELHVVVTLRRRFRRRTCSGCGRRGVPGYDHAQRRWRHLDLAGCKLFLEDDLYRVHCPRCGVKVERVPWAEPGSDFTRDFEDLVAYLAQQTAKTTVQHLLRIAWETVGSILQRVVARRIDGDRLDDLYCIGVDEVSYRRGHRYLTIVADHARRRVVWAKEGRSSDTFAAFFDDLGPQRSAALQSVSMDMSAAYIHTVRERAPNARICFDAFHVVQLANRAVDEVRRAQVAALRGPNTRGRFLRRPTPARTLKRTRWILLKDPDDLAPAERDRISAVQRDNRPLYRAYLLKEELRALYEYRDVGAARSHLRKWLAWASRSRLAPFVKLARTLRQHAQGVTASVLEGLANGLLEGFANRIRLISHRAFGFHSATAVIAMVLLCCTGLLIPLPHR